MEKKITKTISTPVSVGEVGGVNILLHRDRLSLLCENLTHEEAHELALIINTHDPLISAIDAIVAERDRLDRTGDTQTNICELIEQAAKVAKEARGE